MRRASAIIPITQPLLPKSQLSVIHARPVLVYRDSLFGNPHLDITVKSAIGDAKAFAPTWPMVMGYKNGRLTNVEYTEQFIPILQRAGYNRKWDWLHAQAQTTPGNPDRYIVLNCYCKNNVFCHTLLVAYWSGKAFPRFFEDRTGSEQILGRNVIELLDAAIERRQIIEDEDEDQQDFQNRF